jgi:hypothetical protein
LIDDEHKIWKRERYLKDRHWIDRQTKSLTIEILVYNSQEQPLISRILATFQFNRGKTSTIILTKTFGMS